MLSIGGYVGMYQQQKGLAILYEILFTLFGDLTTDRPRSFVDGG